MALYVMPIKTVAARKPNRRFEKIADDDWGSNYLGEWNHGQDNSEIKQITIERKVPVPVFVEKIRHVPVHITKPIFIDRTLPTISIIPRSQNYVHQHYTEFHHIH